MFWTIGMLASVLGPMFVKKSFKFVAISLRLTIIFPAIFNWASFGGIEFFIFTISLIPVPYSRGQSSINQSYIFSQYTIQIYIRHICIYIYWVGDHPKPTRRRANIQADPINVDDFKIVWSDVNKFCSLINFAKRFKAKETQFELKKTTED